MSFILLVLASVVAMVGVFTTVPNRALVVLILLIKITDSAVLVVSTLAAYIIVIGRNGNVENTLLKTVWYLSLHVKFLGSAVMGVVALGYRKWIIGISLMIFAWSPLANPIFSISEESILVVVGHGLAVLAWVDVGFRLWEARKDKPQDALQP